LKFRIKKKQVEKMFYIEKNSGERLIGYAFRIGYTYHAAIVPIFVPITVL
jgi:hypothetical protein